MDTAVAHLCGALHKEAWVLVPQPADWRWMQEGEKTPWYESLILFRQGLRGDWELPIKAIDHSSQHGCYMLMTILFMQLLLLSSW